MEVVFLFAFLSPVKGSSTVEILSCGGFLERRYYSAIMFPSNKAPCGLIQGGLFAKMICRWGLIQGGLLGGASLFEDLHYFTESRLR